MSNRFEISNFYSEINLLKEKIALLEKDNNNINQILNKEMNNKNIGNNLISNEINILKKRQDQFEGAMLRDFNKFKNEIINNLNENNSNMLQNFENIISQYNNANDNYNSGEEEENDNEDDIKKNISDNINNKINIGDELFKENTNYNSHNYSIDSIKSTYLKQKGKGKQKESQKIRFNKKEFDEILNNEFSQYRSELNKNVLKISLIEKKYNGLSTQYYTEIKNINNNIKSLNEFQKNFEIFKNDTISNLKNYKEDFAHNVENNKLFISEISKIIENFQKKLNFYENNNNKKDEQYLLTKNNIDETMKDIMQKLNNELNEFHKSVNNQISEHSREIDNFEKFISQEHEKFVQFIQNHINESISSIKKLFDFNGDDIKKLNEKIDIIQEIIKKVRNDVFKSINDSEEFLENKYQSLFRLINKE